MQFVLIPIISLIAIVGLAVAILLFIDRLNAWIWRIRNPPEKLARKRRLEETRILNPDWALYERHLQRPVPEALRALYADSELVVAAFQYDNLHYISSFLPIGEITLIREPDQSRREVMPIASDEGDPIYLKPGPNEPNAVYIASFHGDYDAEMLASDILLFYESALRAYHTGEGCRPPRLHSR